MTVDSSDGTVCPFCGERVRDATPTDETREVFCSAGCRRVHDALGGGDSHREAATPPGETGGLSGDDRSDRSDRSVRTDRTDGTDRADLDEAYLRVDGMHSATCETYLEAVAGNTPGVADVTASYVTETVRVTYDPERTGVPDLCEALSVTGYTAVPREDAPIDSNAVHDGGERQFESVLGYRYAAGVLFGSFLLLTYVVFFYPMHLSALLGPDTLSMFAPGLEDDSAILILPMYFLMTGVVVVFTGLPLLRGAYVSLKVRQPTTELLVATTVVGAFLYSTVALFLGRTDVYYDLAFVVTAVVVAAVFYESLVKRRAMDQLTGLTVSQIDEATRLDADGDAESVPVDDLAAGDSVLVREGERIPVDGVLAEGSCTVTEAVVTGESLPIDKQAGDAVVGGAVVTDDAAVVTVTDTSRSSIDRLIERVWSQQSADHGVQRGANRIAARVFPAVVVAAVLAGALQLVFGGAPVTGLLAVLVVLLVGSPWGLGLATPLSVATLISEALRRGIVVFDETIFERLRDVDVVVFDKTGTLTTGQMSVIEADAPRDLLSAVATLERRSTHPVAAALTSAFGDERREPAADGDGGTAGSGDGENSDGASPDRVRSFTSHGNGVEGVVDGERVLAGHPDLFAEMAWDVDEGLLSRAGDVRDVGRLPVLVGRNGHAEGLVVVGDEPRPRWESVLESVSERGIQTVVLTGDDPAAAAVFDRHPAVDRVFAGVPPAGKTATIRRLQSEGYVTMVGDGTNDAPALAAADLGIALGGGTAIASDAADVALVENDLAGVETAFTLAHAARRRVRQNNALALVYNGITVPLAAVGSLNPLFAMAGVAVTGCLLWANLRRSLLPD